VEVEGRELVVVMEVKALDREVGQAMEVEVVVARVGMEVEVVGVEEEDLAQAQAQAQVLVAGLVMALDMEEGKVKACHEHSGYLFFCILK
jgi:hypothetical protein